MNDEMRRKLLRDLYISLDDIRSLQRRHREKLDRLEHEEDMTVMSIRELEETLTTKEGN